MRTDIPLADQLVQVGHVCIEAGNRFVQPQTPCHLALIGIPSKDALLDAVAQVEVAGVQCAIFYEPDAGLGYTAVCTEPITGDKRRLFKRFSLWTPPKSCDTPSLRGPPMPE
ncbi:MAG: hypothetical protein KJ069_17565 [Anaerolineae bacterium]|nr:hypothetical protein [Anaerolineae bacterium]